MFDRARGRVRDRAARAAAEVDRSADATLAYPCHSGAMRRHLLTAVAVLALAGCGSTAAPTAAAPTPTPSPTPTHLDERGACAILVPAVQDATVVMKDFLQHTDGSTVDRVALGRSIDVFRQAAANGPADLQQFLTDATAPLVDLNGALTGASNNAVDTMRFSLAAQAILDQCRPFNS